MTTEITADPEGEVTTLFDLGMTYNRDGTITLDQSVLDGVISNHPDSLQAFFLGDDEQNITGLADRINDSLRAITGGTGQIAGERNAAEGRIADLQASIEQETSRLDKKYERLTQEMIHLSQYMDTMESTSSFLSSQFDNIAKNWAGSNKD